MIPHPHYGICYKILRKYTFHSIISYSICSIAVINTIENYKVPKFHLIKRHLTTSKAVQRSKITKTLVIKSYFDNENKNKETFLEAINMYKARERLLRGHVEFIKSAMDYLEEYGVEKELEVYKKLLDIMPKGKMIPTNIFQQEFLHYPKHQHCALEVLDTMEDNGVMPDSELYHILVNTFGNKGRPVLKIRRMLYWMPKFKYACPWPLPHELPKDPRELADMALHQISSIDPASKTTIMQTKDIEDSIDDTWIVSAISPTQQELLATHPKEESLKVEGPFGVMLKDQQISYFVLRAEPRPAKPKPKLSEMDEVKYIPVWVSEERTERDKELITVRSVHEQDDGVIMAMCATGTSSRDSLLSWIRLLEKSNPVLGDIPILFTQSSIIGDIIVSPSDHNPHGNSEPKPPPTTEKS